jgi:Alcohol dehydrogenase GroES-like domain
MTTRPVPYGGPATPVGYFARGPGDLPLFPGHEIAGIVAEVGSEVTKHAVQTMLLDVLAATRDAGALPPGDPVRLGRCCARSHTGPPT